MKSKKEFVLCSQESQNVKEQNICSQNEKPQNDIANLKKPYLNRIEYSKLKVNTLRTKSNKQNTIEQYVQSQDQISNFNEITTKQQPLLSQDNKQKTIRLQSFSEDEVKYNSTQNQPQFDLPLNEWPGRDKEKIFKNSSKMIEYYENNFKQKNHENFQKQNSYKKAENNMLLKIYQELKDLQCETVNFKNALQFFKSHQSFLRIYDLDPALLQDMLRISAQQYQDKLTKLQFLRIFCINYSNQKIDVKEIKSDLQKKCCLDKQNWIELIKIFTQLDTFGDGYIKTLDLFSKMKKKTISKKLLEANAIYFPKIKKYYTLKKIIFQFQYKNSLPEQLTWNIFQDKIINFQHINYPTIDQIHLQLIKKAYILEDSQSFMLKQEVLKIFKKQFHQCPKFYKSFVKCKYFCNELLTSDFIKPFLNEYVRLDLLNAEKVLIDLQSNIKWLKNFGPDFLDLDEMLLYFSVKGNDNLQKMRNLEQMNQIESDEESKFEQRKRQVLKLKKIKIIEKIENIMNNNQQFLKIQKNKQKKKISKTTFVEEFNITKKRIQLTIREQKLKQLIEEKQNRQKSQVKACVKARPIPATNNGQKYLHQLNAFIAKKQQQKTQRAQKRVVDDKKLSYLKTNTKLFHKRNNLEHQHNNNFQKSQKQKFEAKPIQWYIKQRNLLEMIQNEKQERKKNKLKETKQKYVYGYWKKLPYYIICNTKDQKDKEDQKEDSIEKQLKTNRKLQNQKLKIIIKASPVPDFEKLHKQFSKKLQLQRIIRSPTIVKQFNLTPSKLKISIQDLDVKIQDKFKIVTHSLGKQRIIGTTKKYQDMVQKNQRKIAYKKKEQYLKELQNIERKMKKKIFAQFMKIAMRLQRKKGQIKNKKDQKQKNTKNSLRMRQNQLNKMYERVLSRPFMFQNNESDKVVSKKSKERGIAQKLIPKIRIPLQNENYLNSVKQVDWQDRETQRKDLCLHLQSSGLQELNKEYFASSVYNTQDEQQECYRNQQTIKDFHNQSF